MLWVLFPRIQTQLRNHFARRKYEADIDLYQWFQVIRHALRINRDRFPLPFLVDINSNQIINSIIVGSYDQYMATYHVSIAIFPLFLYLGVKILFGEC